MQSKRLCRSCVFRRHVRLYVRELRLVALALRLLLLLQPVQRLLVRPHPLKLLRMLIRHLTVPCFGRRRHPDRLPPVLRVCAHQTCAMPRSELHRSGPVVRHVLRVHSDCKLTITILKLPVLRCVTASCADILWVLYFVFLPVDVMKLYPRFDFLPWEHTQQKAIKGVGQKKTDAIRMKLIMIVSKSWL